MYVKIVCLIVVLLLLILPSMMAQDECEILEALWVDESGKSISFAVEGEKVGLFVNTKNCKGYDAAFSVIKFEGYNPETGFPDGDLISNINHGEIKNDKFFQVWKAERPSGYGVTKDPNYLFYILIFQDEEILTYAEAKQIFPVFKSQPTGTTETSIEIVDLCGDGICQHGEEISCPQDCMDLDILGKIGLYVLIFLIISLLGVGGFVLYKVVKKKKEKQKIIEEKKVLETVPKKEISENPKIEKPPQRQT